MNVLLGVATLAALVLATELILRLFPAVARAVLEDAPADRIAALDGLRGILALSVFLHHGIIAHAYHGGQPWVAPASHFDNLVGNGAVALFFMITAYLFWGRVRARGGQLSWGRFFRRRIGRLAPMYYAAVGLLFLIVAVESDVAVRVPGPVLAEQLGRWLGFGFLGFPDINGVKETYTTLGTLWSLQYEWIFYLALPALAFVYARIGSGWPIYLAVFAYSLTDGGRAFYAFFATGCVAVHILETREPTKKALVLWSATGVVSLLALGWFFHSAAGPLQALLLLPVFVAALQAVGPWTVLRCRPLRFLGRISYSVYLLHHPLIHVFAGLLIGFAGYAALDAYQLYGFIVLMGLGVIALSTLTFIGLEKPFLAGHRPARKGTPMVPVS
jgi:peptidoglycan/LPS O-acetylase OafA/YrhL